MSFFEKIKSQKSRDMGFGIPEATSTNYLLYNFVLKSSLIKFFTHGLNELEEFGESISNERFKSFSERFGLISDCPAMLFLPI